MKIPELKLRIYGDPCLREKSKEVETIGVGERLLIAAMVDAMRRSKGVGLAAPQVGINEQIFVVDIGEGPFAVINPKILKKSGAEEKEEGCLSIPSIQVKVTRPDNISVEYRDEFNSLVRRQFTELAARVFQHEFDHLQGKMIVDYLPPAEKIKVINQFKKLLEENKISHEIRE